jgi:hypothetical protein
MTTIIGITAFLLAAVERFSRLRFRPSPLFRRYFAIDMFYLLTGFVAGGSLVVADSEVSALASISVGRPSSNARLAK